MLHLLCTDRRRRWGRRRCATHNCSWIWNSCSRSCGGGRQSPLITNPRGPCGHCNLPSSRWCNTQCCPVNCRWGSWGSWSSCSVTCGSGISSRKRTHAVSRHCGGLYCSGSAVEIKSCSVVTCCPVHCQWGNWGAYGSCSATCGGGEKTRNRNIGVQARCGGDSCSGANSETIACNSQCCPINCQWSLWGLYGPCSKTCGIGIKTRKRHIAIASFCNGATCIGGDTDIAQCQINQICLSGRQRIEPDLDEPTENSDDVSSAELLIRLYHEITEHDNDSVDLINPGNIVESYYTVVTVSFIAA